MAPTLSEMVRISQPDAHLSQKNGKGAAAPVQKKDGKTKAVKPREYHFRARPGHDKMFNSVIKILEDAYLNDTALTAAELWARADFSGIPEEERPNFTAFCTYLRHKVNKGQLLVRSESQEERTIRRGREKAPFDRYANLFSLPTLTDSVPKVTRPYDQISPLTPEQEEFVKAHPALRTRKVSKQPEKAPDMELAEVAVQVQDKDASDEKPETSQTPPHIPAQRQPSELESSAAMKENSNSVRSLASYRQENARLRVALVYMSKAVSALMEE